MATTSLHTMFETMGFDSYHGTEWRNCTNYRLLYSYDCFSDGVPKDVRHLDKLFPKSKYILQVRDLRPWVYSRLAHIDSEKERGIISSDPTWDNTVQCVVQWIRQRNNYHLDIMKYFMDRPDEFIVINFIKDENAASQIAKFLNQKINVTRPEKNARTHKEYPSNHKDLFLSACKILGLPESEHELDILCPSLLNANELDRFPYDTGTQGTN